MKRRFLGQTLWFWLVAVVVFLAIQGIFALGRLDNPDPQYHRRRVRQRIFLSAGVMAIVSLGLNLIYGFNGQFSWASGASMPSAPTPQPISPTAGTSGDSSGLLFVLSAVVLLALLYCADRPADPAQAWPSWTRCRGSRCT